MRRMAEAAATVAHREGINECPNDLVAVTCAKINVVCTVKFKRVGEPFREDHAPIMQGRSNRVAFVGPSDVIGGPYFLWLYPGR
eukprot:1119973-Pelagomonas_calceolata.AAC.1